MKSIENAIKINKKLNFKRINRIDELIVWLTSLSIMIDKFDLKGVSTSTTSKIDYINGQIKSKLYAYLYLNLTR